MSWVGPDWIAAGNLWPFLQMLVAFARYEPADGEAEALAAGVEASGAERWHAARFVGERTVELRLAQDADRDVILVKIGVASDLIVEVESLIEICQTYELDGGPERTL